MVIQEPVQLTGGQGERLTQEVVLLLVVALRTAQSSPPFTADCVTSYVSVSQPDPPLQAPEQESGVKVTHLPAQSVMLSCTEPALM
jgi:hypothetical protein